MAVEDSAQAATTALHRYPVLGLTDVDLVDQYREVRARIPDQVDGLRDALPPLLADRGRELDAAVTTLVGILDRFTTFTTFGSAGPQAANVSDDPVVSEINPALVGGLVAATDAIDAAARATDELHAALDDRALADSRRVDRAQSLLVWATLLATATAVAAAAAGTYLVWHGTVRRLERLSDNAHRYMQGTRLLPAQASTDEVGQLTERLLVAGDLLTRHAAARGGRHPRQGRVPVTGQPRAEDPPHGAAAPRGDGSTRLPATRHPGRPR